MSTAFATQDQQIISSLVINGDLSKMEPALKVVYYKQYCERLGLDPFTQPFKLLRLQGKEILYCDRSGAQQLNKMHKVSHQVVARETVNGCYVVTARATTDGRQTESIGAVSIDNLKGEALCNAMMKAETKAKRRATLDLLGLGILDETETETIPGAEPLAAPIDVTPAATNAPATGAQQPAADPAPKTKLSAKAFNDLCARIRSNEAGVYEKAIAGCDFTQAQLATLNQIRSQLTSNPNDNSF